MKILYISHSNNFTGSDISLREIINYSSNNGHEGYLSLPYSSNQDYINSLKIDKRKIIFLKPVIWHKIKSKTIFGSIKSFLYRIYKTKGGLIYTLSSLLIFVLKNKIDLIHSNSFVLIEGALVSKLLNLPHVQHVREVLNKKNSPFIFPLL